jgi:hypothetical protein
MQAGRNSVLNRCPNAQQSGEGEGNVCALRVLNTCPNAQQSGDSRGMCVCTQGLLTACGISFGQKIVCFGSNDGTVDEASKFRAGQAEPPDGKFSQVMV